MDHRDFRILGLAASLRRASFHRGIVRAAHDLAPGWMSCEGFDLGRIPYFNQDIEDRGNPEPVKELREKIRAYDAVLIATPEYDYAIPGVLTSALDWCLRSRHDPTPFRHKPVSIVGASPGGGGTARGQMVLRQILLHPSAYVMPEPQMLIPFSRQKFDVETGDLVDEENLSERRPCRPAQSPLPGAIGGLAVRSRRHAAVGSTRKMANTIRKTTAPSTATVGSMRRRLSGRREARREECTDVRCTVGLRPVMMPWI